MTIGYLLGIIIFTGLFIWMECSQSKEIRVIHVMISLMFGVVWPITLFILAFGAACIAMVHISGWWEENGSKITDFKIISWK